VRRQSKARKITVEIPEHLLERARREGESVTEAVRNALELRANQAAWHKLTKWSRKLVWSIGIEQLRED
jgi:hypothetical protein